MMTAMLNLRKVSAGLFVIGLLTTLSVSPSYGANQEDQAKSASGLELPEVGALIVASNDGPRVEKITPVDSRLDKYRDVNIQTGDLIVAASGQRIRTMADLRKVIEAAKQGDEIKIGLQRLGSLVVAAYVVGTESEIQAAREAAKKPPTRVVNGGGCSAVKQKGCSGGPNLMMKVGSNEVPWLELAVVLQDVEGSPKVARAIELPADFPVPAHLEEGVVIKTLQSQPAGSASELVSQFEKIKPGDNVTLTIENKGVLSTISFVKPALPSGCVMIRK